MKRLSYIIFGVICLALAILIVCLCIPSEEAIDLATYKPIEEFRPSFEALNKQQNGLATKSQQAATTAVQEFRIASEYYDIEETVRIINGLEIAQSQSDDFYEFLEYMAKQDYSLVANDIVEAKKRLLPILQRMFVLQKQHEELSGIWAIAKGLNAGLGSLARDTDPIALLSGNFVEALSLNNLIGVNKAKTAIFDEFNRQAKLKSSLAEEIETLKEAYLEYLAEFAPVYNKYMKEWDKLCLEKDKAYLDLYSGRMADAYNASAKILKEYPTNREALLIKSLSLIHLGSGNANEPMNKKEILAIAKDIERPDAVQKRVGWNDLFLEADMTLDNYIEQYPDRSAPALVLKGMLHSRLGEASRALSYFDQAAIEYPRQAEQLTDLMDSYRVRTYLNQTPEGQHLLKLYRSTMEGFGMFSPNFHKAQYFAQIGQHEKSNTEIYNHFFRRGNQGVYDCLLSDMQYCENYLYNGFKQLLLERHYLDISIDGGGFFASDDELEVTVHNRTDIDLENVRIFLCNHYTDMYTDEYDVIKVPTANIIKHYEKRSLGKVKLNYKGKTVKDITRIRAIIMTDDKICWIDDPTFKHSQSSLFATKVGGNGIVAAFPLAAQAKREFAKEFKLDVDNIAKTLTKGMKIIAPEEQDSGSFLDKITFKKYNLRFEIPRVLSFIEPSFSINEINDSQNAVLPVQNYLAGSVIRLEFDYQPSKDGVTPLYIYSSFMNLRVNIVYKKGAYKIRNIDVL